MSRRAFAMAAALAPTLACGGGGDLMTPGPTPSLAFRTDAPAVAPAVVTSPAAPDDACVPFRTRGSAGTIQVAGGPPPAPLEITIHAAGTATHLGRYASTATFTVVFPSPTEAVFDGGGSFTAADGDELHFDYSGDFFPGPVPGGVGTFEIVGGTGRFEGASGSGIVRSEDNATTFDGEICLAR